jgi:hypothetical protein
MVERDRKLAIWFAEGRLDEDVLALSQEHGMDLSLDAVRDKRAQLVAQTNNELAKRGPEFLKKITRGNPVVRIIELDGLCDRLVRCMDIAETDGKVTAVPRLADSLLRTHVRLAEELEIAPREATEAEKQREFMRAMPTDLREELLAHIEAAREVMRQAEERKTLLGQVQVSVFSEPDPDGDD